MTTLIVCIKRKPGLSPADFLTHWQDKHGPLLRACGDFTRHLRSYTQHQMTGDDDRAVAKLFGVSGEYDGISVFEFHSMDAMRQAFQEPAYLASVQPDEKNFVDLDTCQSFVTHPRAVVPSKSGLFDLTGKTAVVTGGAKGVGAMISRTLVAAGVKLLIVARDSDDNRVFAEQLNAYGSCHLLPHDLATSQGVADAAAAVRERADAVHILINNAGTFTAAPIDALTADQWDRELGLNLRTPFLLTQALMPQLKAAMTEGDPARVINIGSIAALWAKSSSAYAYSAAKGGLHQLTRTLASDLTRQGINVNAIAPGFFPSDMTDGFFTAVPGLEEQMVEGIPAHRLGAESDIGGAVVFLASRAGAYVSGTILPVEGGLWST